MKLWWRFTDHDLGLHKDESDEEDDLGFEVVPQEKDEDDDVEMWDVDDEDLDARKKAYIKSKAFSSYLWIHAYSSRTYQISA